MRKPLTNKKNGLSVSIALILGIVTASVNAQTTRNEKEHIEVDIHDSSGKIVRSGAGECWHTHFGQAEQGECNSTPIAKTAAPALMDKTTSIDKPTLITPPIQIEEPVAVRELPIVSTKKLTLDASEFFDFGEPILRPSARAELDDFVEKLKDINPQTITVTGHADRIGSAHYNQILSEQRAATVKAYLVRKGVSPDIVLAEGKGDTQPITKKDQCPSDKAPQTIECLQPDRRVEVEMTGTKTGP
ncbi:OmpA family protein [Candidatus Nitrotoga arctica]|uniref:OmpA-OmpF porin, OOP family n=1 Tax=Candidatus Nitrotoga arctica TaxID=453162 RepID=A0ABN8AKA2_9PROT|nr:OmpA family protein [Candidatus Nitrotoga arctica]CAG9931617.1 OmpA-OmpF porin, OOP family [Candidatus Nitrotoga arctica]